MHWYWLLLLAAFLALALLLAGPLLMGRLFMPGLTLALVRRVGGPVRWLCGRIRPGLDLRLLVRAGNRYFRRRYAAAPYQRRVLFLPFCLRPPHCPAGVDPQEGLCCRGQCQGCQLGGLRAEALSLGYAQVYVVPSSRMLPGLGLLPSDQFIKAKLKQHAPLAALGVVCARHLRNRLLPAHRVGKKGYPLGGGAGSALQGVLLEKDNCRAATVDWELLRRYLQLKTC